MLMALVYFVLPAVLLIIGFPIYAILLITSICAIYFVTDVPLVPGRIVNGTLSTTGDGDSPATTLGYRARVTRIRRHSDPGTFEVEARLEWLDFVAAEPSSPTTSTPCLKPKPQPAWTPRALPRPAGRRS